jgi:hypothetical protein
VVIHNAFPTEADVSSFAQFAQHTVNAIVTIYHVGNYHRPINFSVPKHLQLYNGGKTKFCFNTHCGEPSAAAVEKGGKVHHLHLQCMLWCPKLNSNRDAVQQAAHDMVYNFAGVPKGQNYHVYVELHWPGNAAHVTWRTMVGCVMTNNNSMTHNAVCILLCHCLTVMHILILFQVQCQWLPMSCALTVIFLFAGML